MDKARHDEAAKIPVPDFEALSRNMARFVEEAGKATAAYMKPHEEGRANNNLADDVGEIVKTFGQVAEDWLRDPQRAIEAQGRLATDFLSLWAGTLQRMQGDEAHPVAAPDPKDNRFRDPEWSENPVFDFIKQAYLLTSRWAEALIDDAEHLDEHTRHKAQFYLRQLSSALSPSNFIPTNPELIRETLKRERRQPGPWHADAHRGHRGRRRRDQNPAIRPVEVSGRRQHRRHARQGDLPQRPDRTPAIRADHRDRPEAAAPHRPAVDQQVLHPRPQPRQELHPLGGRSGPDGLLHLVGQPGRAARRQRLRRIHARGRLRGPPRRSRKRRASER